VLTRTLPSSGGFFHRVTLSVAWKDFKEDATISDPTGAAGAQVSRSPITYFPAALGYAGTLTHGPGTLGFDLTGTFAFRGLGSNEAAFDTKRAYATGGFAYLHGGLNYLWNLPKGVQLYSSFEGQVATDPLISNEQMALGGDGSVRGYLVSEAVGDNGVVGSLELRSPSFARMTGTLFDEIRIITFLDAGKVWVLNPLAEQRSNFGLVGVGAGLRLKLLSRLTGQLDFGVPLKHGQATAACTSDCSPTFDQPEPALAAQLLSHGDVENEEDVGSGALRPWCDDDCLACLRLVGLRLVLSQGVDG
jgi:hemolysin activation/secretion protein